MTSWHLILLNAAFMLAVASGRKYTPKHDWLKRQEFKEKWLGPLKRDNMKWGCLLRYYKGIKAGKKDRVIKMTGNFQKAVAAKSIVAPQWLCVTSCRKSSARFRKSPGKVSINMKGAKGPLDKVRIVCNCWPAKKWKKKKLVRTRRKCSMTRLWRPKCNRCGKRHKGRGRYGHGRHGGRHHGHGGHRRQHGRHQSRHQVIVGNKDKDGRRVVKIRPLHWKPPDKPRGHNKPKPKPKTRQHTKKPKAKPRRTKKPKTKSKPKHWKREWDVASYTLDELYAFIEPCMKIKWGDTSTTTTPVGRVVTATVPPPVTKLPEPKTCQCASDVDRDFSVDIHPSKGRNQWLLQWTDYTKLNINIIGYVIVTEIEQQHLYYYVERERTSMCMSHMPHGRNVKFVVKPWIDTVTMNATTRAKFDTGTPMTFTYTPPTFLLLPTVELHSVATHGSASAQLVYMGQRKDADSVQLYAGTGGTARYQSMFTPDRQNKCMVLMRMQFAMADFGARGFISTCGNASIEVDETQESCASVSVPTTQRPTVASTTRAPRTTTLRASTDEACERIACNFERDLCSYSSGGSLDRVRKGKKFAQRSGRMGHAPIGIISGGAAEGKGYAASYLVKREKAALVVRLRQPLSHSIRITNQYYAVTNSMSLRGCCHADGKLCKYRSPAATRHANLRWRQASFVCPKGTTGVSFVCENAKRSIWQGSCAVDAVRCAHETEKETVKCYGKGHCRKRNKCKKKCSKWSSRMKRYSCDTGKCCCYK